MIRLATVYTNNNIPTTLGTYAKPQISYIQGDASPSGGTTGAGILIVDGNLTLPGSFTFDGLVIVYSSGSISYTSNGNANIYGAVVLAGDSTHLTINGGGNSGGIYYSSAALKNISNASGGIGTIGRYLISDWWE